MVDERASSWRREEVEWFEENMEDYMRSFYYGPWKSYRKEARRICLPNIKRQASPRVLDIGCGPYPSIPLEDLQYPSLVVALDASKRLLNSYRSAYPDSRVVLGYLEDLPFADRAFNGVVAFGILHHSPKPEVVVGEINRVLCPGGWLLSTEPSSFWNGKMTTEGERGFELEEYLQLMSDFSVLKSLHYHYPLLRAKFLRFWTILRLNAVFPDDVLWGVCVRVVERILARANVGGTDFLYVFEKR